MKGKKIVNLVGDCGVITSVDKHNQTVEVQYDGFKGMLQFGQFKTLMTVADFKSFPDCRVFAHGVIENSINGVYMTEAGGKLRWVAKKGIDDWCIYVGWESETVQYITDYGDKLFKENHIRRCVPCTDELFKKYRY